MDLSVTILRGARPPADRPAADRPGCTVMYMSGEDEALERATRAGRKLAAAREKVDEALGAARFAGLEAIASGVPEAVLAREMNVSRMTVRKWLGKREWNEGRK
jgi:DNA invertase Pin-like site-specific DNA recombinase